MYEGFLASDSNYRAHRTKMDRHHPPILYNQFPPPRPPPSPKANHYPSGADAAASWSTEFQVGVETRATQRRVKLLSPLPPVQPELYQPPVLPAFSNVRGHVVKTHESYSPRSISTRKDNVPQVVNLEADVQDKPKRKHCLVRAEGRGGHETLEAAPRRRATIEKHRDKFKPLPKLHGKTKPGRSAVRLDGEVTAYYEDEGPVKEWLAVSPSQMS